MKRIAIIGANRMTKADVIAGITAMIDAAESHHNKDRGLVLDTIYTDDLIDRTKYLGFPDKKSHKVLKFNEQKVDMRNENKHRETCARNKAKRKKRKKRKK